MSQIPDAIVLRRDRDLESRQNHIWVRRGLFALICVVPVLALANLFGQHPQTSSGAVAAARFSVSAPSRVRGGLLYQARFRIDAKERIAQAELVLDRGWIDGLTINTMEPSPTSETSQNGKLALDLGPIPRGQSYVLFVDFQVNPTTVGRQDQGVTLYDGNRPLVSLHRTLTIFP
ncbi:MAG TPA: hypothetical protein VHQ99_00735 [Gaiellaceae bacterium]|nr:hypothetical protein [Gaiellaceae bacterium]